MRRIRFALLMIAIIVLFFLGQSLIDNPLFFKDIRRAIGDVQGELSLTGLLVILLLWAGIEVNERSKKQAKSFPKHKVKLHQASSQPLNHLFRQSLRQRLRQPSSRLSPQSSNQRLQRLLFPRLQWLSRRPNAPIASSSSSHQADFWQGISTELIGAVISTITLGMLVLIFQQYSAIQNRKADLILQLGSDERIWAVEAARQLREEGWIDDGTLIDAPLDFANLVGANLVNANLSDANLSYANLSEADLSEVNLSEASLPEVNLNEANLTYADLSHVNLEYANLSQAILTYADLSDTTLWYVNLNDANLQSVTLINVDLRYADLSDVNLTYADLNNANLRNTDLSRADLSNANLNNADFTDSNLENVIFNRETILPDGTNWTPETNMLRFTSPIHRTYWNICFEGNPIPDYCN